MVELGEDGFGWSKRLEPALSRGLRAAERDCVWKLASSARWCRRGGGGEVVALEFRGVAQQW